MKLKSRPDDFQVEELTSIVPGDVGAYSYYRLSKQGVGTPEAIQRVCRELHIDGRRVRYGGLKDRHAQTIQYLTIEDGPQRNFKDNTLTLQYLGKVEEPYGPQSFSGNRFVIMIRDLDSDALEYAQASLEEIKHGLVANYFDDQRFGSVSSDHQFVARALIDGNDELALKLAIATYYEHDRSQEKKAKASLRSDWGNWSRLIKIMPRGMQLSVVQRLLHNPDDYRSAFCQIPFFLRNMYLSAYQSYLWNKVLSHWLCQELAAEQRLIITLKHQQLPMPIRLDAEQTIRLQKVTIPLFSARMDPFENHPAYTSIIAVLAEEGLQVSDIRLKHYREPFFSRGDRPACYHPEDLSYEAGWDKLNKGHRRLKIIFSLPRGSYATLLVKRITSR